MRKLLALACVAAFGGGLAAQQANLQSVAAQELPALLTTYQSLHAAPELSHHEERTSAFFAAQLRQLGFEVTERVGKYDNPAWTSYGVVAVLKNGAGPTVWLRTELDALPVQEQTGLPYASHVIAKNDSGQDVPVMHACGHDIHMTAMLGAAQTLAGMKDRWHGTLVIVGQPAEETVNGAHAMLADHLYERFPRPTMVIAEHDTPDLAVGQVGLVGGYKQASATAVTITLYGVGAHGSKPEASKDPVVAGAELVVALQSIVSREQSPFDPTVVTVGSLQAGLKGNIIPDTATLQLSVRTYNEDSRQHILASIERMSKGVALTDGLPADKPPLVQVTEFTPATYNDPALTQRLQKIFTTELGAGNVVEVPRMMSSEDVGQFGLEGHPIPVCDFELGASDPAKLADSRRTGVPLPSLHSSLFAPVPGPTITTGIRALSAAVLDVMH